MEFLAARVAAGRTIADIGGGEIDYRESVILSTTAGTLAITNLQIVVPADSYPVLMSFGGAVYNDTAAGITMLELIVDDVTVAQKGQYKSQVANEKGEISKSVRLASSGVARTIKVRLRRISGVNALCDGAVDQPAWIHAVEL